MTDWIHKNFQSKESLLYVSKQGNLMAITQQMCYSWKAEVQLTLVAQQWTQYNGAQLTTQPLESNLRSDMQRKLRLQPPLSFVQSLTGPKESRRTSRESKEELIISSSLSKRTSEKIKISFTAEGLSEPLVLQRWELVACLPLNYIKER